MNSYIETKYIMRKIFLFTVLLVWAGSGFAQFDKYFHDKTLRMDYFHCGDSAHEEYYFN